ncbi:MAG: NAD(P)-binding protein [Woeseiaceae bacterium]|nr:NAD(P)-binding protein [Woeseiaceae bacterium]NIP21633.1 NAD(P)-binding protein [Woeseiaceae bacterium]NIS90607.1 NAD(P)-binding protein [Woeseiaceae bacterium]
MSRTYEMLIVGAGVTGLTVAALLGQSKHSDRFDITVVDAGSRPHHDPDGDVALRVSAIAAGSAQLLDSIGAWQTICATRASPYESMRVWDESVEPDSLGALQFDAAEFAVPQLGFIVENALIQHALLRVLDKLDVTLVFDSKVDRLEADLVIGADGARSHVRDAFGIGTRDFPYGQTAFVTHLRPENPHRRTALQRFTTDGPLGMLPLIDGRVSIVWSIHDVLAERVQGASDDDLGEILSEASDYVLGRLEAAGPRGSFPLCARHATQYVMPGMALIGDAAHAIHPLAGQGANLGMQDAAKLAEVIDTALREGEHPGDRPVLRRYERARKGENATMLHFMTGLNKLFATDSAIVRELRVAGMRLFNYSGPIRDHAVKVALGMGQ